MPIQPGTDIGRYHILEQLGEGGMAVVYKAYDTQLEREVALKVLRSGQGSNDKFIKRFKLEARALAKLNHPNIVKILDYGEQDGLPYLVMEYVPGQTLKQKIGKPMDYKQAAAILAPIADALAYAHEHKILHRDVKPSNILIKEDGTPLLSDFGIAKMLELDETMDLTGTGVGMGTPEYMAPELGLGEPGNEKADQYSLGIVFYELVTGRKPFRADTPLAVLRKHTDEPLPRPRQYNPDLPENVERVLFKALAKRPQDRFDSILNLSQALKQLSQGEKVGVGRVASQQKGKQNLAIIGIGAAAVILLIAMFFLRGGLNAPIDLEKAATLMREATYTAFRSQMNQSSTESSLDQTRFALTPSATNKPLPTRTIQPSITLPMVTREFKIDGKPDDWTEADLILQDKTSDSLDNQLDLTKMYAYLENGFLYFMIRTTKPIVEPLAFLEIWFDTTDAPACTFSGGDFNSNLHRVSKSPYTSSFTKFCDNGRLANEGISPPTAQQLISSWGEVIEYRIALEIFGEMEHFILNDVQLNGYRNSNFVPFDSFQGSKVLINENNKELLSKITTPVENTPGSTKSKTIIEVDGKDREWSGISNCQPDALNDSLIGSQFDISEVCLAEDGENYYLLIRTVKPPEKQNVEIDMWFDLVPGNQTVCYENSEINISTNPRSSSIGYGRTDVGTTLGPGSTLCSFNGERELTLSKAKWGDVIELQLSKKEIPDRDYFKLVQMFLNGSSDGKQWVSGVDEFP